MLWNSQCGCSVSTETLRPAGVNFGWSCPGRALGRWTWLRQDTREEGDEADSAARPLDLSLRWECDSILASPFTSYVCHFTTPCCAWGGTQSSQSLSVWLKSRDITGLTSLLRSQEWCFLVYLFPVFYVFMNFGFVYLVYTTCNHENVIELFWQYQSPPLSLLKCLF